jgi:hypothetical protein
VVESAWPFATRGRAALIRPDKLLCTVDRRNIKGFSNSNELFAISNVTQRVVWAKFESVNVMSVGKT